MVGLVAVVALAVGLGIGAIAFGGSDDGTSGEGRTAAISLPAEIDGYPELMKAIEANDPPAKLHKEQGANQEKVAAATAAAYSKAFGGAAAAYRSYADASLEEMPYVIAVRTEAPGLVIGPVLDPGFLDLVNAQREVRSVGEVECQIVWGPPAVKGTRPDPSSELTTNCQRTGAGMTVFVGSAGFEGPDGLKSMASFTEAAWKAVAKG
jgi:hypothetical protein